MKNDHLQEIKRFREQLANIGQTPRIFSSPADAIYFQIRKDIPEGLHIEDYPVQVQIISVAKKSLFMVTPTNQLFLIMFAGAISAFRNPKAHSNKEIITAEEAMRRIMFASSLLYKLYDNK